MATNSRSVPVLIVGGGSVGLIASVLLARHGVRSLVAERHSGTSILPRAFGINVRTMEIYVPTARPGHRAPHYLLSCGGWRRSTIDLFDGKFVALSPSERWCDAARDAGATLGIPVSAYVIADPASAARYGVGQDGAVLVRPDGYVAWRRAGACADLPGELHRAIDTVLCRDRAAE
jgi:hypothetical protein